MTVQDEFHSYQSNPIQPFPGKCAPICVTWGNTLVEEWGGIIGCYEVRKIDGSSLWSTHASGAAIDWSYNNRGVVDSEVLPLFLNKSDELGVQAIHDEGGGNDRIWRPPGTNGRPTQPSPECGWKPFDAGPVGAHLHIECLLSRWGDTRPFGDIDGTDEDNDGTLLDCWLCSCPGTVYRHDAVDTMGLVLDDGGRIAAGFQPTEMDCAIRAVAIGTGHPYTQVYEAFRDEQRKRRIPFAPSFGVTIGMMHTVLVGRYRWRWVEMAARLRAADLPSGRLVAACGNLKLADTTGHVVAVIDHQLHDIGPSSEQETVFGVWTPR